MISPRELLGTFVDKTQGLNVFGLHRKIRSKNVIIYYLGNRGKSSYVTRSGKILEPNTFPASFPRAARGSLQCIMFQFIRKVKDFPKAL